MYNLALIQTISSIILELLFKYVPMCHFDTAYKNNKYQLLYTYSIQVLDLYTL